MWLISLLLTSPAHAFCYWYGCGYDWDGDGWTTWNGDCNDYDWYTNPGAYEYPGDGRDSNCDGYENCFEDRDYDGWGSGYLTYTFDWYCSQGGTSTNAADCNDSVGYIYPGAYEYVASGTDENCDGVESCWRDADGDAYGVGTTVNSGNLSCSDAGEAWGTGDCNDGNAGINPGSGEGVADGVDQNCDGRETCWYDADGDTYGGTSTTTSSDVDCSDPGESWNASDCNDGNGSVSPSAIEGAGDNVDQNCDSRETCYTDADNDGARLTTTVASVDADCNDASEGLASDGLDCNDGSSAIRPGVAEVAGDNVDQNCDNVESCYTDADNDGARTATTFTSTDTDCTDANEGLASDSVDCADTNAAIRPGAAEIQGDEVDQDCDARETCWPDVDNDNDRANVGSAASTDTDCADANEGRTADPVDCDDNNASRASGNVETVGNNVDNNCDGQELCHADVDGDNARTTTSIVSADSDCSDGAEEPSTSPVDCNDADSAVAPGLPEVAGNGVDNNCDGGETCYLDDDNDDYRVTATLASSDADCNDSREALTSAGIDCVDTNAAINPSAPEIPGNGTDENCDGADGALDADADGYNTTVDCNDGNAAINPGAAEIAGDNVDQNCDARESCYVDADDDGARTATTVLGPDANCNSVGEGVAADPLDCNDANVAIRPGATEVAGDNVDQDCNNTELCYADVDNDGARLSTTVASADTDCTDASEAVAGDPADCNDTNAGISPLVAEVPADGVDQNCDLGDTCFRDTDSDTFGSTTTVASSDLDCVDAGESGRSDDCNDAAAATFPGAPEVTADNVDQNCDSREVCYTDADDDNTGTSVTFLSADTDCNDANEAPVAGDCNDASATVRPGATEGVADGVDQNCDGLESCRQDADGDGFGSPTGTTASSDLDCTDPGEATTTTDCDDAAATVRPGAPEIPGNGVDDACDGGELCYADLDNDDYGRTSTQASADLDCTDAGEAPVNTDCDDGSGAVNPGATEIVGNGIDDDCNGVSRCFTDDDHDGVGTTAMNSADADCADAGEAAVAGDCDDSDPGNRPGGSEVVGDGADQDCDGLDRCYVDDDGDGDAAEGVTVNAPDCAVAPYTAILGADCDDDDVDISRDAIEIIGDGVDQDCSGGETCWRDLDNDGYGGPTMVPSADLDCADPGEESQGADCDGADASIHPFAVDAPLDLVDSNCDGMEQCLEDPDEDGWAAVGAPLVDGDIACEDPGFTRFDGDCDEGDADIHPLAAEISGDSIDQDCDGGDLVGCYLDGDGDGVGDALGNDPNGDGECDDNGRSALGGDCDDADPGTYPGAPEIPADGLDQDCDGGDAAGCYVDQDNDGYGVGALVPSVDPTCSIAGFALVPGDCEDALTDVYPSAPEVLGDGLDQDCDGTDSRECFVDLDGDGIGGSLVVDPDGDCTDDLDQAELGGDCDDNDDTIAPGLVEILSDGIDQDCDGSDLFGCYADLDSDGFGSATVLADGDGVCDEPGRTAIGGDCDDGDNTVYPGAFELVADGIDQSCDSREACYADPDLDGWAEAAAATVDGDVFCTEAGTTAALGDCGENDDSVYPGAPETTNDGIDQDCAGGDLEGCWLDQDGDTFGSDTLVYDADGVCEPGVSTNVGGDCSDLDPNVHPGAAEVVADGFDQDCDGFDVCYRDQDHDGVGAEEIEALSCNTSITSRIDGDCNDLDETVLPGATETCGDGVDQDCDGFGGPDGDDDEDGLVFEDEVALGLDDCDADTDGDGIDDLTEVGDVEYPTDSDGDGVIDALEPYEPIEPGTGETAEPPVETGAHTGTVDPPDPDDRDGDGVPADEDCDDEDPDVFPGAPEDLGGRDLDCDGLSDPTSPVKLACGCDTTPRGALGLAALLPFVLGVLRRRR